MAKKKAAKRKYEKKSPSKYDNTLSVEGSFLDVLKLSANPKNYKKKSGEKDTPSQET